MLPDEEGKETVRYARIIIESYVTGKPLKQLPERNLGQLAGVFVTLNTFPKKELRGCIGIPEAVMSLRNALIQAAQSATQDPRFPPLRSDELQNIVIEITILTPPTVIQVDNPYDYPKKIIVGKDGLIVEKKFNRGLLLPQVPVEWKWNSEEFLSHTCLKAGLSADAWKDEEITVFKFQGVIFTEVEPGGEIIKKMIYNDENESGK